MATFIDTIMAAAGAAAALIAVSLFFIQLFRGRISLRWIREKLWWF